MSDEMFAIIEFMIQSIFKVLQCPCMVHQKNESPKINQCMIVRVASLVIVSLFDQITAFQDEISRVLLRILQASGKATEFLATIVMEEVKNLGKPYAEF